MNNGHEKRLDSAEIRQRIAGTKGKEFWSGIHELAETEEFQQFLEDEFPQQMRPLRAQVDRRQFLTLMGASLALAGLSGCRFFKQEKIVPYVDKPEELIPGLPLYYATATTLGGYAFGLIAESHEGRPTKLEGNPQHPASLGATHTRAQASILNLYDPDRAVNVLYRGEPDAQGDIRTWDGRDSFLVAAQKELLNANLNPKTDLKLRILTETITSPTLTAQIEQLLKTYPQAKWHQYESVNRDSVYAGAQRAFGEPVNTYYALDKADVVLTLDAELFQDLPGSIRYARHFMDKRRVREDKTKMNRLYSVESTPTLTGIAADHLLTLRPSEIELYARALANELGVSGGSVSLPASIPEKWIKAVAEDLRRNAGKSVIIVGDYQPPAVHALAHAMNEKLQNVGSTVLHTDLLHAEPNQTASLRALVDDMNAGQVEMLIVLGGNPVYTAPADIDLAKSLREKKVKFTAHLGMYDDETSALCGWHIPETHFLEAWSDARAFDGTTSIVQPLIAPLYEPARSAHELVAAFLSQPPDGYALVSGYWKTKTPGQNFDKFWEKSLNEGVVANTRQPLKQVTVQPGFDPGPAPAPPGKDLEIIFRPDPTIWDGHFANNGWLQELPKPITRLTWDNVALMSPATAVKLQLAPSVDPSHLEEAQQERVVKLTYKGRSVDAPVWLLPGHPDNAVTVHLGYGRTHAGVVGNGYGFNANALRTADAPWFGAGLDVAKSGDKYRLSTTQYHHAMEGRDLIRVRDIADFTKDPHAKPAGAGHGHGAPAHDEHGATEEHGHTGHEQPITLYDGKEHEYDGYAWGMSVDLNTCIGCNACVTACQSENNIPVIGKDQVARGRAMHWIRIDSYYRGEDVNRPTGTYFQPVMCMHCEQAPCEPVCPVAATVHSAEGLNQMVYNRCVGTKYCSNNCPYKVRRFNFYKYTAGQPNFEAGHGFDPPVMKLINNPNVTVRGRGVMEKCTFCVQRINAARITSKKERRDIRDGEIVTACQQACPTQAIVFGNIRDKESRVAKLKEQPHDYVLLEDVNTRPRVSYLSKLKNPNPELAG